MALPITGVSLGNPNDAAAIAIARGGNHPDNIRRYAQQLWKRGAELGVRADVAFGQADLETGNRDTGVGFQSKRWDEGNPAGISITNDKPDSEAGPVFTPEVWADIHIAHLAGYAGIDPGPELRALDIRWQAMIDAGYFGVATTVDDLDQRWAWDPRGSQDYGGKIEARWRLYNFAAMDQWTPAVGGTTGGTDVAGYTVNWPGVPGGPITFSFPVHLNIVPAWRTTQRSGLKARSPRYSVQHENGNRASGARSDSMYLYNGAEGRSASWHGSVDDIEGYINLPGDEVGWQAGDGSGPGNMNGFAVELCQLAYMKGAAAGRKARRNAAEMMGRVAGARLKASPPPRQHATFMVKNCPEFLRNNPQWWNEYVDDWYFFRDDELKRMAGETPVPEQPDVIEIGDTLRTLVNLNMRQSASLSAPVIATLPVDAEVVVSGRWSSADGYGWLPVRHTLNSGTVEGYVAQGDASGPYLAWVKSAPKPEPEPEYVPAVPIPALLETDLNKYDTAEGITTDDTGNEFIFVADVIEFTKETVAGEYALPKPRPVRKPYQPGERAIAAWLVKAKQDNAYYYVLAGGDNEWARVPYASTKRISDAPLLGDDMHAEVDGEPEAA